MTAWEITGVFLKEPYISIQKLWPKSDLFYDYFYSLIDYISLKPGPVISESIFSYW